MTLKEAKAALAAAQEAYKAADEAYKAAGERVCVAEAAMREAERAKPLSKRASEMLTKMAIGPVMITCDRYRKSHKLRTALALVGLGFASNKRFGALLWFSITDAGRAKLGGKP